MQKRNEQNQFHQKKGEQEFIQLTDQIFSNSILKDSYANQNTSLYTINKSFFKKQINIKTIYQTIVQQDASYIKQNFKFIKSIIKPLFQTKEAWQGNKYLYGGQLNNLMRILYTQIEQYLDYKKLFSEWFSLKNHYLKVTKVEKLTKVQYSKHQQTEQAKKAKKRNQILRQYSEKYKLVDPLILGEDGPQPIAWYVGKHFPKTKGWSQIFSALHLDLQKEESQLQFIKNIHNERHLPKDFICCSPFYYQGVGIYNKWIDSYNDIDIIDSSQDVIETQIQQKVVSLLNGKGGLILFDVVKNLTQFICKEVEVSEIIKQHTQQKIEIYLDKVNPKIRKNQHYCFEWVPVMENPLFVKEKSFIKGKFVLRMKVFPIQPQVTYHFLNNRKDAQFFKKNEENRKQYLNGQQVYNFMKERFLINHEAKCTHQHQFYDQQNPESGHKLQSIYSTQIKKGSQYEEQAIQFQYSSLLKSDLKNIMHVKFLLDRQKIAFQINRVQPFYKSTITQTTWILSHNQKFDKVKLIIKKKDLKYGEKKKDVILIPTQKSLRISNLAQDACNQYLKKQLGKRLQSLNPQYITMNKNLCIILKTYLEAIEINTALLLNGIFPRFEKLRRYNN